MLDLQEMKNFEIDVEGRTAWAETGDRGRIHHCSGHPRSSYGLW